MILLLSVQYCNGCTCTCTIVVALDLVPLCVAVIVAVHVPVQVLQSIVQVQVSTVLYCTVLAYRGQYCTSSVP